MSKRSIIVVALAGCAAALLGLAGAILPAAPTVQAALPPAPLGFTNALSYTVRLPFIASCYSARIADPGFSSQWDMSKINADDAWFACGPTGGGVTIAVIDSGVDLTHPDLMTNLLPGYDFVYYDNTPEDGDGHGSNVAGIAAAALNGVGVVGVAPAASILPVRVLDEDGLGYISDIADGIRYAADRAAILNLSLGGPGTNQTLQDAINYAANTKGRLVIAAGGNCGSSSYAANGCSYQHQPVYPAAYSNVMAVASTDSLDARSLFSNIGSYVDIAAPGSSIYNADRFNDWMTVSGTSQAAPHVAGLAALVWSKYPGYTAAQVRSRITSTAIDLGAAGTDTSFGAGRIDAKNALGIVSMHSMAATPVVANAPDLEPSNQSIVDQREAEIRPGRVLVKFKDPSAGEKLTLSQFDVERTLEGLDVYVLNVPVDSEWTVIDQLRALPNVQYAEPDYRMWALR
jgi:thermitase